MKYEWCKCIDEMRDEGYAVAVFSPEELGTVSPDAVEKWMVENGWEAINMNQIEDGGLA